MTELQIDANIKLGEWSVIQESGRELKLVYGPSFTGLQNLGNSCYMNSVMQVLFTLPEFKERWVWSVGVVFMLSVDIMILQWILLTNKLETQQKILTLKCKFMLLW